jgi:hypothetical protein
MLILINTIFLLYDFDSYIFFLEKYISPDGNITRPFITIIELYFILTVLALFFLHINIKLDEITSFFSRVSIQIRIAYIITITFIILFLCLSNIQSLYKEDGFFENLNALFFLLSSLILMLCGIKYNKYTNRLFLFFLSILMFFFSMEEISWGQRIFGWATPQILEKTNFQNEINIHNLFNPLSKYIYLALSISLGGFIYFQKKIVKKFYNKLKLFRILNLTPNPEFFYFSYVFIGIGFINYFDVFDELFEGVLSILVLFYSIDILILLKKSTQQKFQ